MENAAAKQTKGPTIFALRCLSPNCNTLLAYEVDKDNFLYIDLSWTARHADAMDFLPCPGCGGKNVLESATDAKGARRPRVTRFVL